MAEIIDIEENEVLEIALPSEIKGNAVPLLTAEREKDLARIIQNSESTELQKEQAISEMASSNINLVKHTAYSYSKRCKIEVEELTSVGYQGLMRAIYKFDPAFGTKFSTYAVPWIKQSIRKFIRESAIVSIPAYTQNNLYRQGQIEKDLPEGQELSDEELQDALDLTDDGLENLKKARISRISLDDQVNGDSDDGDGLSFYDVLPDETDVTGIEQMEREEQIKIVKALVAALQPMEQDIILSQCMGEEKENLAEIGERWGLTGERVRQIREKTFTNLRKDIVKRLG